MSSSNNLFKTLTSKQLSHERRLSFIPYMLFFSCGCPDVMTLIMKSENLIELIDAAIVAVKSRTQLCDELAIRLDNFNN